MLHPLHIGVMLTHDILHIWHRTCHAFMLFLYPIAYSLGVCWFYHLPRLTLILNHSHSQKWLHSYGHIWLLFSISAKWACCAYWSPRCQHHLIHGQCHRTSPGWTVLLICVLLSCHLSLDGTRSTGAKTSRPRVIPCPHCQVAMFCQCHYRFHSNFALHLLNIWSCTKFCTTVRNTLLAPR